MPPEAPVVEGTHPEVDPGPERTEDRGTPLTPLLVKARRPPADSTASELVSCFLVRAKRGDWQDWQARASEGRGAKREVGSTRTATVERSVVGGTARRGIRRSVPLECLPVETPQHHLAMTVPNPSARQAKPQRTRQAHQGPPCRALRAHFRRPQGPRIRCRPWRQDPRWRR